MPPASATLAERAPAKVNLTLRVLGRRADGYHRLESLVVFAEPHDRLTLSPGGPLDLVVTGPTAPQAGDDADNLVLKAARLLADVVPDLTSGRFELIKNLPVAAGLGGGSSDAAAALRLLARANGLPVDDPRLCAVAAKVGADVPVCLAAKARIMSGIGEVLSPVLKMPPIHAVLINPGVAVPTRAVFTALDLPLGGPVQPETASEPPMEHEALTAWLERSANDLEPPAVRIAPAIADVLSALRTVGDCRLARMSGSGATCFGLFGSADAAAAAAGGLAEAKRGWWVQATLLA